MQFTAVMLLLFPLFVSLILNVGFLFEVKFMDISAMVTNVYLFMVAVCSLVAYLLLGRIASSPVTGNVVRWVGIFLFLLELCDIGFHAYKEAYGMGTMAYSLSSGLFMLLEVFSTFYMFGVIVRNNPSCRRAVCAITVNVLGAHILFIILSQTLPLLVNQVHWAYIQFVDVVKVLIVLGTYYALFTSEVFGGKKSAFQAPEGAYRFWNKYLTWFVITVIGMPVLLALFSI